jgi:hypothetical protein
MFIEGMLNNKPVDFIYIGGSKPGSPRTVNVSLVFQLEEEGRVYVAGYCKNGGLTNRRWRSSLVLEQSWAAKARGNGTTNCD